MSPRDRQILILLRAEGELTLGMIATRFTLSTSHASRIVAALVDRKLVERRENPLDRRMTLHSLTPAGRQETAPVAA